jgi:hypothetical protein
MNREVHVRFRERLRGKFPRATRPQMQGIRGTHNGIRGTDFTGYGARYSRDTRHGFDGIRGTRKIIKMAWSPYTAWVSGFRKNQLIFF